MWGAGEVRKVYFSVYSCYKPLWRGRATTRTIESGNDSTLLYFISGILVCSASLGSMLYAFQPFLRSYSPGLIALLSEIEVISLIEADI